MGQVLSYLWKRLSPNAKKATQINDQQNNYQTLYLDNSEEKQQLESYYINISDHVDPIPSLGTEISWIHDINCSYGSSSTPNIVLDLISENEEDFYDDDQVIAEVVLEKSVTTKINYANSVKQLGTYTSAQRLLLVGEGDFSFSASLAVAFGTSALNIIATSLDHEDFLTKNYRNFRKNKAKLETRGNTILHGVDATDMVNHPILGGMTFDRVIFNFPHAGEFGRTNLELRMHQKLLSGFLRNAKKMIREAGEIHITSKSNGFFRRWDIPKLGSEQGLYLIQAVSFNRLVYPGYVTKFGFGGNKNFYCDPSKTYKFGLYIL